MFEVWAVARKNDRGNIRTFERVCDYKWRDDAERHADQIIEERGLNPEDVIVQFKFENEYEYPVDELRDYGLPPA